jgi:hypothetical protein
MLASEYRSIDLLHSVLDLYIARDLESEEFIDISTSEDGDTDYDAIKHY